jgi:hypothetical protein
LKGEDAQPGSMAAIPNILGQSLNSVEEKTPLILNKKEKVSSACCSEL